ncbi:MAG: hypothetical protein L6R41_001709 [Letrouitia leprolyta]|nr:MAG: hypothetical protein L6R41_001709 [Letrouitia leprolyta]
MANSNKNQSSGHPLTRECQKTALDVGDSQSERRIRNSFDGFSSRLYDAASVNESIVSNIRDEDWIFTGFSHDMPLPSASDHGRSYGTDDTEQDPTTFVTEQIHHMANKEYSQTAQERITRWLGRLPSTHYVTEESTVESESSPGSSSEESFGCSVSFNKVNIVLAKRGESLFRKRSQGDWELRRPSEVQEEARTQRSSSQSSWGSNEGPRCVRQRLDEIDFDVVEGLKGFSFTSTRWGRKLSRPDSRPMSPRALACEQQRSVPHVQATVETPCPAHDFWVLQSGSSEASCKPAQSRMWFSWLKKHI